MLPGRYWSHFSGLILGLRSANERRRYKVTPSLIGWDKTRISLLFNLRKWAASDLVLAENISSNNFRIILPARTLQLLWRASNQYLQKAATNTSVITLNGFFRELHQEY